MAKWFHCVNSILTDTLQGTETQKLQNLKQKIVSGSAVINDIL
jgi:hypothetical protein